MRTHIERLRLRFLLGLTATGALAHAACGSTTRDDSPGAGGAAGSGGAASGGLTSAGGSVSSGGSVATGGSAGSAGAPPACQYGKPVTTCYTLAQLEHMLNNPYMGGEAPPFPDDAGVDGGYIVVEECLPAAQVQDDCCNGAMSGPVEQGEQCCYVFCTGACCGRAFVVGGEQRLPGCVAGSDWLAERVAPVGELEPAMGRALARSWLDDARMEHASIASFAKFTLELLSLGAPADLVADAQRAALDEVAHAQLCFTLASRYSGQDRGPAALNVQGALGSVSLADVAVATLREGCVGETLAAVVARAQLEGATDEAVRSALGRIAEDEERHAELAWSFLRWALSVGGAAVAERVRDAAAGLDPAATVGFGLDVESDPAWRAHGRLTSEELASVQREVMTGVVAPCVRALLDGDVDEIELERPLDVARRDLYQEAPSAAVDVDAV